MLRERLRQRERESKRVTHTYAHTHTKTHTQTQSERQGDRERDPSSPRRKTVVFQSLPVTSSSRSRLTVEVFKTVEKSFTPLPLVCETPWRAEQDVERIKACHLVSDDRRVALLFFLNIRL